MTVDYISQLNAGSGLNTTEIVDSIVAAERDPKANIIQTAKEKRNTEISALGEVLNDFKKFDSELSDLEGKNGMKVVNTSSALAVEIVSASTASSSSHQIEISNLASAHSLVFGGHSSESVAVGTGTLTFDFGTWTDSSTFSANSSRESKTITIDSTNNTLTGLKDAVNAAAMDVTASIIKTSSDSYAIAFKSREGAANGMRLTTNESPSASGLANFSFTSVDTSKQTLAAADATLKIDGVTAVRDSNTITDLIDGLSLSLTATTSATKIGVEYDKAVAYSTIQTFVEKFNVLRTSLGNLTRRGLNGDDSGSLAGNSLIRAFESKLRSYTTTPIKGYGANDLFLTDFGVSTLQSGALALSKTKFETAFEANPENFAAIVQTQVKSSSGSVAGSVSGEDYTPGTFTFDIASDGNATINGIAMTKNNNNYTVSSGEAQGINIAILGSGADATLFVGKSLLNTLRDYSQSLTASSGSLQNRISAYSLDLSKYDDDLTELDKNIAAVRKRYTEQFTAMESAVRSLKDTGKFLDNFTEAWKASLNN